MLLLRFFEHQLTTNVRMSVCWWECSHVCVLCSAVLCQIGASAVFVCGWMLFLFFSIVSWLGQYAQYHVVISVPRTTLAMLTVLTTLLRPNQIFEVVSLSHVLSFCFICCSFCIRTADDDDDGCQWHLLKTKWIFQTDSLRERMQINHKLFYFVLFLW